MDNLSAFLNDGIMLQQMEDGSVVSDKVARIVEKVRAYDSRLDVKWIPRAKRDPNDDAFIVTERTADGREFPVMSIRDESFMDERLLKRLVEMDQEKQGDVLAKIDRDNAKIKKDREQVALDERAEAHEIAQSILRSPKDTYKHNGQKFTF